MGDLQNNSNNNATLHPEGAPLSTKSSMVSISIKDADAPIAGIANIPKARKEMYLRFDNVNCFLNTGGKAKGKPASADVAAANERQILYGVTGVVKPGEVVAIMGPSGSGKTTFITLLAGRNACRHSGDILYNNRYTPRDKAFTKYLGYVMQEDALYEGLTVYETLYYTAVLRLPANVTDAEKRERVETIMECLGISHVRNSIIGGNRIARRGVSGGEKKRVAIGQELLFNPSVILLDEPTSGLDSTTALSLINTLNTLAKEGNRTVLTTIHQPSSRIYQKLDKLLLLGLGNVLYFGDASQAHEYFREIGYPMPYGMNCADFLLDTASGWGGPNQGKEEGYSSGDPELKSLLKAIEAKPFHVPQETDVDDVHVSEKGKFVDDTKGCGFLTQIKVIAVRSVKDRRFERFSGDTIFTMSFVAILTGLLWFRAGQDKDTTIGAMDLSGVLFFKLTYLSFSLLFTSIFTFPTEKTMMIKERAAGMYPISAFFFGRTLADLPIDTCLPIVVFTTVYIFVGLEASAEAYLMHLLVVLLTCFVAASLGLFLGAVTLNLKRAQTAATVIMISCMLTGGFFVREVPGWASWIRYVSYIMYAWSATVKIHMRAQIDQCTAFPEDGSSICDYKTFPYGSNGWAEIGILFGILITLRTAVYLSLRWRTKE